MIILIFVTLILQFMIKRIKLLIKYMLVVVSVEYGVIDVLVLPVKLLILLFMIEMENLFVN